MIQQLGTDDGRRELVYLFKKDSDEEVVVISR